LNAAATNYLKISEGEKTYLLLRILSELFNNICFSILVPVSWWVFRLGTRRFSLFGNLLYRVFIIYSFLIYWPIFME